MSTAELRRHRWTRDEWSELDPIAFQQCELIDGEIIEMSPMGQPHAIITDHICEVFTLALQARAPCVGSQTPIIIDDHSEPEPDVWVAGVPRAELRFGKPIPEELLLVVEVSDSSLRVDRRMKIPVYARAGIAETWIVDVGAARVERFAEPADGRYVLHEVHPVDSMLTSPWGHRFEVRALLTP
ncbi:MAG: Uma2 family endonuclease [Ilumatobacter sp.]